MSTRTRGLLALAAIIALAGTGRVGRAELPAHTVVVTRAGSVESGVLPTLVKLDEGIFSSLELVEAFALNAGHQASTILTYKVGDSMAVAVTASEFVAPSPSVRFFDPALNDTKSARSVGAGSDGEASFEVDAEVRTLTQLLAPPGSTLFFAVPEPERALALAVGVVVLGWFARSRRSGSYHAAR